MRLYEESALSTSTSPSREIGTEPKVQFIVQCVHPFVRACIFDFPFERGEEQIKKRVHTNQTEKIVIDECGILNQAPAASAFA